jgi:hypothetical protein
MEMADTSVHVDNFEVPPMRQIADKGQSTLFCWRPAYRGIQGLQRFQKAVERPSDEP